MSTLTTIAVVSLLFLSFAVVLVSVASADIVGRTYTREGGVVTYVGTLRTGSSRDGYDTEPNQILVFKGEKIYFKNATTGPKDIIVAGPYDADGDSKDTKPFHPTVAGEPWDCTKKSNYYKVTEADNPSIGGWFGVRSQSFTLKLKKSEVRENEKFTLEMDKNNKMEGVMKLSIKKDDYLITNLGSTYINDIPIRYDNDTKFRRYDDEHEDVWISFENGTLVFDTTELNMKEGIYTIYLEDFATEVKKNVKIKIKKVFLEVNLEEEEVVKGEDIVIKITSSFYKGKVNVTVRDFYDKTFLPLDEDGKIKVTVPTGTEDVMYGKHKVTVEVCGTTEKETKYVTVKKGEASLGEVPEDATVGDIVHIEGISDFGDFAVFLVDNVFKGEARISDGEFEWDWDTSGEHEGCHEIEVFILREHAPFSTGENVSVNWQRGEGVDASAIICLLSPKPPTPEISIFTDKKVYSPGDTMKTSFRISNPADDTQALSFNWCLGIPEYDLWVEIAAMHVNLPLGYNQVFTVSIPVGDWGTERFCGCHLVSLSETTTGEVVSMDSTVWTYSPGAMSTSKAAAEIVTEISETIGWIDKQIENV
jgi:hypothetical protein